MAITEVPIPQRNSKEVEVKKSEFDIKDLDLSPLFVEPPITGVFATFLPWINMVLLLIVIIILFFK